MTAVGAFAIKWPIRNVDITIQYRINKFPHHPQNQQNKGIHTEPTDLLLGQPTSGAFSWSIKPPTRSISDDMLPFYISEKNQFTHGGSEKCCSNFNFSADFFLYRTGWARFFSHRQPHHDVQIYLHAYEISLCNTSLISWTSLGMVVSLKSDHQALHMIVSSG